MTRLHRRNFLPAFIVNLILWISTIFIVIFLDPEKNVQFTIYNLQLKIFPNILLLFFILTLSLTLTFALLFGNTRRGFIASLFIVSLLLLKMFKIFH